VGVFIAAILLTAGLGTLLILPSLVTLLEKWLFPPPRGARGGEVAETPQPLD
jgi:hypothetical protein